MEVISQEALLDRQRAVAEVLADGAVLLKSLVRSADYFTGFTTAEAITERLAQIGSDPASTTASYNGKLTKFAALNQAEATLLAAIKATKELGAIDVATYDKGAPETVTPNLK